MSIATYAELSTAVADWMHRSGITATVPDLITIGEAKLNRELRLFSMEATDDTVVTSITTRFGTLPSRFLEAISLSLYVDNYPQILNQVALTEINTESTTEQIRPTRYAITSNIVFDTISDEVYTCSLRYYKKLDIATDLTNTILTNYPDLYLYSAMVAGSLYTKNKDFTVELSLLLQDAIRGTNRVDGRTRSKVQLRTEVSNVHSGNILTG